MKTKGLVLDSRSYKGTVMPPLALEDDSRFGNDGVFTNVTWVRLPSGLWVMSFNGATSIVNCGSNISLSSYVMGVFSFESWVYANSDGEINAGRVFHKEPGYLLALINETGAGCLLETLVDLSITDAHFLSSTRLTVGAWHYLVMVYNRLGTKYVEVYLDGEATAGAATQGVGTLIDDTAAVLCLGNRVAGDRTFDGEISMPRIYSYALTPAQIYAHFQAERRLFGR